MKKILLLLPLLSGCMTINNYIEVPAGSACGNITVNISTEKVIPISPAITTSGNTVPVSAIP